MKLTTIIILSMSLSVSAEGIAQNITLNEKNVPLQRVFKLIEKQSDFVFFYENAIIQNAPNVSIRVKDASISDVLNICFKNQPLDFTIEGNTIGLKRKNIPKSNIIPDTLKATPQPPAVVITGKVVDTAGTPLAGVTVLLKGTQSQAVTDNNGNYSLTIPEKKGILVFSSVGYESREIAIGNNSIIAVTLRVKVSVLNQVVVIGYINDTVIEVAKSKDYSPAKVEFQIADIFNLADTVKQESLFGGFIWSHIQRQDLNNFIDITNRLARRGATIVFMDNNYVEGSSLCYPH